MTTLAPATSASTKPRKQHRKATAYTRRQWLTGYLFLSPWLIGFLCFQLLPIVFTFFLSFTDYTAATEFKWGAFRMVGLANYRNLLIDPAALPSMGNTLKFAAISIPPA